MDGLWIDPVIMALKRTPVERHLLARICYRAAGADGLCRDSNRALAESIGVHSQTVSDCVRALDKAGLIKSVVNKSESNGRTIRPSSELLEPYQQKADKYYKPNTDRPIRKKLIGSKENPDSGISEIPIGSKSEADTPISQILIGSKENPDSHYKEERIIENKKENKEKQQQHDAPDGAVDDDDLGSDDFSENKKREQAPPPNPLPTADDVRAALLKSDRCWRYAFEQLKLVENRDQYSAVIETFIIQQEIKAEDEPDKPTFSQYFRKHFMNWLGDRHTRTDNSKPNGNATTYKRTTGSLKPTALGQPNYRGYGSTCDVDL